ncbi:MAG: cytochrome C biogenesis protein CcdA [Gammaproteobacteria bacterium]|nr:cytochrome C biogenesis protein CcdA [Gammaproteobacteria bacterium]|tara:strand:- start:141644 stop:141991 length:348 start_codon:yes stop_codon:yes gene_type:complete
MLRFHSIINVKNKFILTLTTTDKKSISEKIAKELIASKIAACVSIHSPTTTYYFWGGKIRKDKEWMIMIKSPKHNYEKVEKLIKKLHNYELPEIISIKIESGSKKYLNWIANETK